MRSEERRAVRRKRREEKRAAKKRARSAECTFDKVADLESLYKAQKQAAQGVRWKASTQRYQWHWLLNINKARKALLAGEEICRGFHEFDITQRGKHRHISSVHFSERVVQKSLTQNVLIPAIVPSLIRGNTANIKGRGTSFAIRLAKDSLVRHYADHGAEGYILQGDFCDYFGSIPHDGLFEHMDRYIDDERAKALARHLIEVQGPRGLGLGSEPNQIFAVSYPNALDHLVAECCGVEAYIRYMDDFMVIHRNKATLQCVLAIMHDTSRLLGLELHPKKTQISKLTRGFVFLKKRFTYDIETGRVVVRPCRESVTRERRKLKRQAGLVIAGKMSAEQLRQSYQSWRGSMLALDAHRTVASMDALFGRLIHAAADGRGIRPAPVETVNLLPIGGPTDERSNEWTR